MRQAHQFVISRTHACTIHPTPSSCIQIRRKTGAITGLLLTGLLCLVAAAPVSALPYNSGLLDFSLTGQSMWDPDPAVILDETVFVGFDTGLFGGKVGGFTGGISTVKIPCVPIPFFGGCVIGTGTSYDIDSTTGAELRGSIDARVGFDVGVKVDSGSVDVSYPTEVNFELPGILARGQAFNLMPTNSVTDASLQTTFPTLEAYADLVIDVSGSVGAEACVIGNCEGGDVPITFDPPDLELVSFNRDASGKLRLLGTDQLVFNFGDPIDITRQIPPPPAPGGISQSLGDVTIFVPNLTTNGAMEAATGNVVAAGEADVLQLGLDIDGVLSFAFPALKALGLSASVGPFGIGYDILDFDAGPFVEITQDFIFDPTLMVTLDFDQEALVDGFGAVDTITASLETLPDITLLGSALGITPTFFLDNLFTNMTGLEIDPFMELNLLSLMADFSVGPFDFGLLDVSLLDLPLRLENGLGFNVFKNSFALDFPSFTTESFIVTVPEPGIVALLGLGFVGVVVMRRRTLAAFV